MNPELPLSVRNPRRVGARVKPNSLSRRQLIGAAAAAAATTAIGNRHAFARQATPVATPVPAGRDWRNERWVGTWAASPHVAGEGFGDEFPSQIFELDNQTVRQIARVSVGGDQVRVRIANTFGDAPLVIGAARIALRDAGERIDPGSDRPLTFSGVPSIIIPPGALALSDPVIMTVAPLSELAISVYFPEPTTTTTVHGFALQTNSISPLGDFTAEAAMPVESTMQTWVFLAGIDVSVSRSSAAIVALGDSITDGFGSTPDTNQRWPDHLAERLASNVDQSATGVLNQGIGGNRLLHDGIGDFAFAGQSALARFDRDVLAQSGVTHLIVFEGINDIGFPAISGDPTEAVSADELIAALRQLAERAHERDIVTFGATITPFEGAMYFSPEGEETRQEVNAWIRNGGAFDAVLDFDVVVRDPYSPAIILPAFDVGDHLHINDAGYQAMAESIDLDLFQPATPG